MTRSAWDRSPAEGATGQRFEIRTVADFLRVPQERRRVCLREFHSWLAVPEELVAMFDDGAAMGSVVVARDVFVWTDDGKGEVDTLVTFTAFAGEESPVADLSATPSALDRLELLRQELADVRAEINAQYWRFTRCANSAPVDPALRRREAALEAELREAGKAHP